LSAVTEDMLRTYADSDGLGLAALVRKGEVAPIELVETAVVAIEKINPQLNAVISKLYDMGRAAAKDVDLNAPFAGVPYLLKELRTKWKDAPVTGSSSYLRNVRADSDTEVVKRIKAAGFLLVGKSNAPENGWSLSTEPKLYGATFNPWRKGITAGGSSGGAASAVASGMVPIAEATDAAGSIRVPASCCGVVGLKPTRGRLTASPAGDVWHGCAYAFCNTRTVRDTAAYLDAVAGGLPGDPYTPPIPEGSWSELARREPKKLRIAFSVAPPDEGPVDPHVVTAVQRTVSALGKLGHDVEQHDLIFDAPRAWETYARMGSVQTALFFDSMEPTVGRPVTAHDVEPVTWATISRGRSIPATRHLADVDSVRQFGRSIAADLAPYDVFITPTLTQKPRPLGYYDMSETDLDRFNALWFDAAFMFPFNASGQPAISLPLHWSPEGDPIGVQLVGRFGDEATLLSLSSVLEKEMPWRDRKPPICV
jgi:amidase